MTEQEIEKLKRKIALRKLIIEEQREVARLAQRCADTEYAKLKRMETGLDELVKLEKEGEKQ